ncbi:hypothetical protein DFH07DRAFT_861558 [Mycena maculata]|uniref:Uncharacterized protein n=1 Tax=Mycena maculata TaxID=230809 RepID=A0AAD7HCS5_9AGAR|nr:hypothetical protein DFH07DRAFT_861558 [Mycena maculata]
MGHGHALFALFWKLILVFLLAQVALSEAAQASSSPGSSKSVLPSSPASPSLSVFQTSSAGNSSATGASPTSLSSMSTPLLTNSTSSPPTNGQNTTTPSNSASDTASSHFSRSSHLPTSFASSSPTQSLEGNSDSAPPGPTSAQTVPTGTNASTALETSPSPTAAVLASSKSNKTPVIAGVVVPVLVIILGAGGFIFYKRHKRTRDRREWERTHEEIADAVRQVGGPAAARAMSPYSSGSWSHLDHPSRAGTGVGYVAVHDGSGDTVTNPFFDKPVGYQSAEYAAARPAFAAPPTGFSVAANSPHYVPEPGSHPAGSMESESSED